MYILNLNGRDKMGNKKKYSLFIIFGIFFMTVTGYTQQEIKIRITEGIAMIPVAIPQFVFSENISY